MDNIERRIQELDREMREILDSAVHECATDEAGHKVKRCNQCMQNMGRTAEHEVICLKELEAEQ